MTSRTNKNASINQNISKVEPLTPEEVDAMLLEDELIFGPSPTILMKCERCGCEMELDAEILGEMAEADGEDELSCICMNCGRGNMYPVK